MTATADAPPVSRLAAALADAGHLFTAEQVAYLMATASRWGRESVEGEPSPLTYAAGLADGYRARVAEENAAYPPEPHQVTSSAGADAVRVYRRQAGVDVVEPRLDDFHGLGSDYVAELRQRWATADA